LNDAKTNMVLAEDKKIFEPECLNIGCPECLCGRIYYDRAIGFYCMPCGHEFSLEEVEILIVKTTITSWSVQNSTKSTKKPVVEIKELPTRRSDEVEYLRHDVNGQKPRDVST
jgi:hypothetical protein